MQDKDSEQTGIFGNKDWLDALENKADAKTAENDNIRIINARSGISLYHAAIESKQFELADYILTVLARHKLIRKKG